LLASIKAVGIVQSPVILSERKGDNGYAIHFGHRRVAQAVAAGLSESAFLSRTPTLTTMQCAHWWKMWRASR
jgi:hypothetical protein